MPNRKVKKQEIETMLKQIKDKDSISIFNARKACYIHIDHKGLVSDITKWLEDKLKTEDYQK
jgi:hypothetical protein